MKLKKITKTVANSILEKSICVHPVIGFDALGRVTWNCGNRDRCLADMNTEYFGERTAAGDWKYYRIIR